MQEIMVKIDNSPKLDFANVLITPKRSTLNSRKEVNLEREFKFSHGQTWSGVPIMAANMAVTGTFGVYEVLKQFKMLTCLQKFYTLEDFQEYTKDHELDPEYFIVSTGIRENDYENLCNICDNIKTSGFVLMLRMDISRTCLFLQEGSYSISQPYYYCGECCNI